MVELQTARVANDVLLITWADNPDEVPVVISHPLIYRNNLVVLNRGQGLKSYDAFHDPDDENSTTFPVHNAIYCPAAAWLAWRVANRELPDGPVDPIPTNEEAIKLIHG